MEELNQTPSSPAGGRSGAAKVFLTIVVIVLIGLAGYFLVSNNKSDKDSDVTPVNNQEEAVPNDQNVGPEAGDSVKPAEESQPIVDEGPALTATKTFTLTSKNFSFSQTEIRVKKGDKVKIVLQVQEGFHDWVIDEFNAKTSQVAAPNTTQVEFTADQAGTFEYYCSVGQHRQMGMVGKLIVE